MKVVIVTTSFPRDSGDASGHFVAAEAAALAEAGNDVTVIAPGSAHDSPAQVRVLSLPDGDAFGWPGVLPRLHARPWRAFGVAAFVIRATAALKRLPTPDRVIAHWIVPAAWPIARAAAAPLEVVAHGSDVRMLARAPSVVRRHIARQLLARGATFRFVSHELLEQFVALTEEAVRARSVVQPTTLWLGEVPTRTLARAQLGVGDSERLIVVMARLLATKRVDVALAAALLVPRSRAVVVGDGPERAPLARAFPTVQFIGRVPRQRALTVLAAADVLIHASAHEGAPTVVREARALGVPVVAVPCGDVAQWAERDPDLHVIRRHPRI